MRQLLEKCFKPKKLALTMLAAAAIGASQPAKAALPALVDFRDQVIYLIMVDRFANGDKSNDGRADVKNPHAYHGGDLKGVRQKLDYLRDLGVTTLWLTPVNKNQDGAYLGKYWGYHGYWIQDFDRVDPRMGTEDDLKGLVADAHQRGLKVLLDVVVNHCGYDAPIVKDPAKAAWFHHNGNITHWDDPYECENFDLVGLPDFASERKEVLDFMERAWGGWVQRDGIDGFRLDTVRHVPMSFWHHFLGRMRELAARPFFTVGEVSFHDPALVAPYLPGAALDSAFDFPMFETLGRVFAKGQPATLLARRLGQDSHYADPSKLSPFLDSHDEVRFLTAAGGDVRKLKLALACLLTLRGTPCLTYGTEVGMIGGADPDNRHDMTWGAHPDLLAYSRDLIHQRLAHEALCRGVQQTLVSDVHMIAYTRVTRREQALVVLNNQAKGAVYNLRLGAGLKALNGARWHDLRTGRVVRIVGQRIVATLPGYGAAVFVPE